MFFLNSVRRAPGVRSALAAACGVVVAGASCAQGADELEPVVVTASRMVQLLQTAPIGATVITSEQIRRSGAADANEAIRKLAGVPGRADLGNGRENSLDLRGFGETSSQNTVVLIDGVRVSENEIASARLSALPLDLIDRIEIVRGGSSVAWGEGASSGAINVILKQAPVGARAFKLLAAVENRGGQEWQAGGQWGLGQASLDASAKRVRSDGARDNSGYKQDVLNLGLGWREGAYSAGLRLVQEHQDADLPGSISLSRYQQAPRAASTPQDHARTDVSRLMANLGWKQGDWQAQLDLAQRTRDAESQYVLYGSGAKSSSVQSQIAPRVSHLLKAGATELRSVVGLDWQGWDYDADGYYGTETGNQENRAGFVQFDLGLPTQTRVTAGWREEHVRKQGLVGLIGLDYDRRDKLHAGELGVNQTLVKGVDVYGRAASSYRLPNVDENRVTPANGPLRPQRNSDREIGIKLAQGGQSLTVRRFVQKTVDEIAYFVDAANPYGANMNLDPTQRRGVELEGRWVVTPAWSLQATWQQVTAKFRQGALAGKEMVLVAPHTATLRSAYRVDDHQTLDVGVQYLARSRAGGDGDNSCGFRVPSSTLLDARYAWSDKDWTLALSGTNLADRKGYNYAYVYQCGEPSIYPYAGRTLKATLSRQF